MTQYEKHRALLAALLMHGDSFTGTEFHQIRKEAVGPGNTHLVVLGYITGASGVGHTVTQKGLDFLRGAS